MHNRTSLGGKPEGSESEEETLIRETKEELDCDIKITRRLLDMTDKAVFDDADVHLTFYLGELIGTPEIIDNELEEFAYIPADYAAKGIKLSPSLVNSVIPFLVKEGLITW